MGKYQIGLDLGTSAAKGVLYAAGEGIVSTSSSPFSLCDARLPDGSAYIGIDAEEYYRTVCKVIRELARHLPAEEKITAVSMVSASGNTLLCGGTGTPMICAYSWTNPPMTKEVSAVFGNVDAAAVAESAGWQFSHTFSLAHLSHLRFHAPDLLDAAAKVCTTTEYALYRLTGRWGTDPSTATPTYLYDQKKGVWNEKFCEKLGISTDRLPELFGSGTELGRITGQASVETGLQPETRVVLGSFDHPGAARASGVIREGQLLLSCGTSWVCFFPCSDRDRVLREHLLCDPFLFPEGPWGAIFSLPKISAQINGLVEKYVSAAENRFEIFSELAESAEPGAGGLRIDPTRESQPDLSGFPRENVARALMESVAFLLRERLDQFRERGVVFRSAVMAGGPSQSRVWREILSEILGFPIEVRYGPFSGAVGAAMFCDNVKENSR